MSRKLRWILIILGLFIVVVLVLPFLIPVNQFRPVIEAKASAAIGRKVMFGHLSLSILTGSVAAENLSIGDDPRFSKSPFLTAKSIKVGVQLIPLIFSKALNVTGVTIENPRVTLLRNSSGEWNFSSFGGSSADPAKPAPAAASRPSSSSPPPEVSINKLELSDGTIIIGSTGSSKRNTYDHVNVTASSVSMRSRFPVAVSADLPGGGNLKFDGKVGPLDHADASLTPFDARLDVSSLNLATTGFLDPKAGLGGLLDLNATMSSKNGEAETKGTARLSKALLVAGGSPSTQPVVVDFHTRYDLRKSAGVLEPSAVKIGKAVANLSGTYCTVGNATVVNVKLNGQNMPAQDLQSFLPAVGVSLPKGATLQGGTLNADLNLTGPTNKLVTSGNVALTGAKLAGFDLGSRMSAISALAGIKTGKDLQIEKLTTGLQMSPGGLKAENFLLLIPSLGKLVGAGTIDSRNALDFKMVATVPNTVATAGSPVAGALGLLSQLTGGGCKGVMTVPFLVQGTTADPKFVPDVRGLAANLLKSRSGCSTSSTSSTTGTKKQQAPANPLQGITNLFGKKKQP